jgi:hypothetical protein
MLSSFTLSARDYDEVESNNILEGGTANSLTLPIANVVGNAGQGTGAYDGGFYDAYSFAAGPGATLDFQVEYDRQCDFSQATQSGVVAGFIDDQYLANSDPDHAWLFAGQGGFVEAIRTLDGTEVGQLYFVVQNDNSAGTSPATDYYVTARASANGLYDEQEPNDLPSDGSTYNYIAAFDTEHSFTWDGNLGFAYGFPMYDGDRWDTFTFGAPGFELGIGETVNLNLTYDDTHGLYGLMLLDSAGTTLLAGSHDHDGSEAISYTVTGAEAQPFVIVCSAADQSSDGGWGDYLLTGTR